MTTTLPNRIIKYFVDTSNPSQSGFYFYEKAGTGGFVRLGPLADASRAGGNTFEIDSSTAENVIYNGLGGADTYVVRSNLDKNIEISDPHTGDDGSGNEAKNTIVFDSDVTVTSINQVTRLEEADILRIELTLDTGAVITVNGPDAFEYAVGDVAALDFAGFIATYGDSGIAPANRAPVIENVPTDLSIDENADGSTVPVPVGQIAASDADASDSLTYSIVNAVDQNGGSVTGFEVDSAGLITYVGTGLDAETITSVALTVSASDGEDSTETSVAISVRNIDEGNARFVVTSDGDITAAAVGDVLTIRTISADPDGNDAFTYQWYRDGAEIADATGASYTIPEDYNRNSIYVVVRYTDGSGTNEVVTLSGILAPAPMDNIATTVALGAGAVTSLAENADTSARTKIADIVLMDADGGSTGMLELAGAHADMFEVDGNVLYLKAGASLDYESVDTLNIRVQLAEDVSVWVDASIAVANVDEGNARFVVTSAGDVLTVGMRSSDPDGNDAFTYQWYRDGVDIAGATGASYTITEGDEGNSIYVVVRYTDGSGTNEVVTLSGILADAPVDVIAPAVAPATPAILNVADLDPATTGFSLTGERYRDFSGYEVSSVGDINGDNIDDFAIGAPAADPNGDRSGATYIIYGQTDGFSANINLRNLNAGDGFRIVGENRGDLSGGSVSSGDVNGDGFNDIIIGALQAEPDGDHINHNSGSTYVVFGKSGGYSGTVNLSSIVTNGDGFRLDGENRSDWSGEFVSAGDINGDGYDDVIIGVSWVGYNGDGGRSGSTYVVFGKPDNPDESNDLNGIMSLSELDGSDGFRIDGGGPVDWSGRFVSSGDVNGDGYDDIIIGARYVGQYDDNGDWSGTAYVVFGKANDANDSSDFDAIMRLSEIDGSNGFRIEGVNYHGLSGLSSAGDINGDGNDDIIIGFNAVARNGNWIGASYIVFGKANDASGASTFDANVRLSELDGSDGFRIEGTNADDHSGLFVSSAGDFNGDGFDDVIIGAHGAESNGVSSSSSGSTYISSSGSTYIVFGKETGFSDTIRLSDLDGSDGVRIDGAHRSYNIDYSAVSSAGDVNDDGYDDVIIGASGAGPNGSSYIVYGYATSGTDADENTDTAAPANIIVKYFVDTSNPSQSGFYFYEVAGDDNLVRLDRVHEGTLGGDDTFEIDSPTAELVIYNGLGGADTYVIRGRLDNDVQIHDIDFGDDGSGNEVKNTIVFASDVTVTSIHQDRLQGRADVIKIEQTLDTDAVVTVHVPDAFEYVVGGAAALDFAEFIATYGASGISATNRAPVFENEPTDLSINENADGSAVPVSVGRVVATDADAGDTLTYSIVSTADQNGDSVTGFEVDGTGLITYVGTGLNAETITSVALTVSASDGQESAQTSVAISVTNIDEGNASFVVTSNRDINAAVAGDVLTVGTRSSDPDGDGTFTYQWYRDGAEIAGATDARYTITESDEGNSLYVAVSYTDGSGTNEVVTASGIIVPANTAPVFENVPTALFGENVDGTKTLVSVGRITTKDAADAVTYSIVSAVDQNGGNVTGFDVDGTGFITYIGTGIDAEIVTLVALTISARNGGGSAEAVVAVQIANFDEGNARFVVTSDGDITAAAVGDVLTIRTISADPDGNGAFAYQWYRDGAEIADATGASYTIPEDHDGNSIYVVVRYTDGSGTNEVVTLSGIIAPAPVDVIAPAVALGAGAVTSLAENADTSARTKIADIVLTDADGGSTGTLELAGNHADMFEVVGTVLYLKAGVSLDHESVDALNLRVQLAEDSTVGVGTSIAVADIDEGNASFVVTSDGYLNAAVAGDVLTVRMRSSDPDGDGTFTYQWYRDGVDIAGATGTIYTIPEDYDGNSIYVVVRYTDGSGADETVTASGIIVPVLADNDDDASEDPVNTTYTMTQAPTGVSLTRGGVALSVGETFTYQDIQGGWVALTVNDENALSGLRLTTDDGTDANPAEISLDIEVREVADIAAPEAGNDLDYSENEGSLVIDTGDYGDQITAAQGSDFITGGLGDDTINLDPIEGRETGQDTVVYNFGSGSIFTATDGGDDITGFKRGEDIFLLKTESDNPELATLDGLLSYVSGPDKGSSHDDVMIVTPNYVFGPEDGGNNIVVTGITGITFHFEDAGTYGGGYLAQGHVSITFDEQLDWAEFLSLIEIDNGDGTVDENFNYGRGLIRDLSALPNLMGEGSLAYEVEAPAQTPPQDVDVPLEDDIPATSFDVV